MPKCDLCHKSKKTRAYSFKGKEKIKTRLCKDCYTKKVYRPWLRHVTLATSVRKRKKRKKK